MRRLGEDVHLETLLCAAEGKDIDEMAEEWGVSRRTVMNRRQAALAWMGAKNMCEAVYMACRLGILK